MADDKVVFTDGEELTADVLITLQDHLYNRLKLHSHTGDAEGPKLSGAALQDSAVDTAQVKDGAITQPKLDPALFRTLKDGPSTLGQFHYVGYREQELSSAAMLPIGGGQELPPGEPAANPGVHAEMAALNPGASLAIPASSAYRIIGNPVLVLPEWDVSPAVGSNIKGIYRKVGTPPPNRPSEPAPSVIHIDFVKPYKDAGYVVSATSDWDQATPQPLVVRRRDAAFVELTVPDGKYESLAFSFSLTIFGELAP